MSESADTGEYTVCSNCDEIISADQDNCPSCGKGTPGMGPWIAVGIGLVIALASLLRIGDLWFFTLLGLAMAVGGGWLIWHSRKRRSEAADRLDAGEEPWSPDTS